MAFVDGRVACALPGGLVRGERRLTEVALRPLTGHGEDWLARHHGASAVEATTALLGYALEAADGLAPQELARELLVGDRAFVMLELRRMTLGDRVQAVLCCTGCEAKIDVAFAVSDVEIEARPQDETSWTLELGERSARYRLPNGGDQEAAVEAGVEQGVDVLVRRCVVDDGGRPLDAQERDALAAAMEVRAPQVELELDVTCPDCGHAFVAPLDLTAFFLSEMRINAGALLRELHEIALRYHWSEAQILDLPRDRRRAYLELLHEAARA